MERNSQTGVPTWVLQLLQGLGNLSPNAPTESAGPIQPSTQAGPGGWLVTNISGVEKPVETTPELVSSPRPQTESAGPTIEEVTSGTSPTASQVGNDIVPTGNGWYGIPRPPLPIPEKPYFDGSSRHNPIKFLASFEQYRRSYHLDDRQALDAALGCLKGNARSWTAIHQGRFMTFEQFKKSFLKAFWSDNKQRDIRHQISTGRYDPSKGTMLAHFAHYVEMANMLSPAMPETTIVAEIMRHYPDAIQHLWALTQQKTIEGTADFLIEQEIPGQNAASSGAYAATNGGVRERFGQRTRPTETLSTETVGQMGTQRERPQPRPPRNFNSGDRWHYQNRRPYFNDNKPKRQPYHQPRAENKKQGNENEVPKRV